MTFRMWVIFRLEVIQGSLVPCQGSLPTEVGGSQCRQRLDFIKEGGLSCKSTCREKHLLLQATKLKEATHVSIVSVGGLFAPFQQ